MSNWKPQDKKYFGPYQGKSHSEMKEIYSNIKVDWNSIKHRIKKSFSEEELNARKRRYLTGIQEFDSITKGLPSGVTVFIGAEGTGKSQPLSELILTPKGWTTMGKLKVGDYVAGEDGNFHKVLAIYPQGVKDTYKVTFSDGATVKCSLDHLWLTENEHERHRKRKGSVKTLRDILKTFVIKRKSGISKQHYIPLTKPINFKERSLKIHPYIMGVLLGDGCFFNTIAFSTQDKEIADRVRNLLKEDTKISYKPKYTYTFKKKQRDNKQNYIKKAIVDYGLFEKRSHEKFIPEDYLLNSVKNRIELLQGLLDTDGTLDYRNGKSIRYSTTSPTLAKNIAFLIQTLGGVCKIRSRTTKYRYRDEIRKGRTCYRLNIVLPEYIVPFKLNRKKRIYKPNEKYLPKRYINSVTYCGKEEHQCIYTENKSHLYLTRDCIVTHNSLLARNIAVKSKKALYFYCESILDPPDPQIHPNVIPIDYSNPAYIPEYRKAIKQLLLFIEHLNPELVVIDSITKFFSVSKQALPESPLRFAMNDLHSLAIDLCPIICICEERGEGYNRGAAGGKGVLHSCNMEICFYKTFIESESQSLKYQRDINDVAYIMYVNKDKSGLSSLRKYLIDYNGDYTFKQL